MATSDQDVLVVDLARDVVEQAAPQELPLFKATSQAYLKNAKKLNKSGRDEMLGFGVSEAAMFITPIALTVTKDVVLYLAQEARQTLKTESADTINEFIKAQFKKLHPAGAAQAPKAQTPSGPKTPGLTPEQIATIHQMAYQKALAFKLSDARAKLFADAMVGSLVLPNPAGAV